MNIEEFKKREKEWTIDVKEYFSNCKLNNLKFIDTIIEFDGYVTTSIVVDDLRIDFDLTYDYDEINDKPLVRISLSSPIKRGTKDFKVTGKNTSPEKIKFFILKKILK